MAYRGFGLQQPNHLLIPQPPSDVDTFLMTGGSSAQAQDWLSSAGVAGANAAAAEVHFARFTGLTTAGGTFNFMVNLRTTQANVPAAGSSHGSTGVSHPVISQQTFQIPGDSTGFSIAAYTSGIVMVEQWRRGG